MIFQALPWTLGLIGMTTIIAFLLGTVAGIVAGWRRGGALDSCSLDVRDPAPCPTSWWACC